MNLHLNSIKDPGIRLRALVLIAEYFNTHGLKGSIQDFWISQFKQHTDLFSPEDVALLFGTEN